MPREREGYRENYEMLLDRFPGKVMLTLREVSHMFEIDPRTAAKRYPFQNRTISIPTLARCMCPKEER
jgi:hypothetical protein